MKLLPYAKELKHGYIVEKEIEKYIFELIPEISGCRSLPETFYPFYVFTASRRFFFYLDSKYNSRKLNIDVLAHSTVMEEFLFFKRLSDFEQQQEQQNDNDGKQVPVVSETSGTNWFSSENAMKVYTSYINLDKDQNGMLSQRELISLNSCICGINPSPIQLTSIAVSRLFEEYITFYPREMDYKTFLDLILALENKTSKQSLHYFWRVLDIEKSGRLSSKNIEYFYNDIYNCLKSLNYEAPSLHNIVIEIYDILSSNHPDGPTYQEFVDSGQGHTVITMLLDVHGFWSYDNRETIIAQQQAEAQEAERLKQQEDEQQQSTQKSSSSPSSSRSPLTPHSPSSSPFNQHKQNHRNPYSDDEDDEYNSSSDNYYNEHDIDDSNSSASYSEFEKFNDKLQDMNMNTSSTANTSTTSGSNGNQSNGDSGSKRNNQLFTTTERERGGSKQSDQRQNKNNNQQQQQHKEVEVTEMEDYEDDYYDDDFND